MLARNLCMGILTTGSQTRRHFGGELIFQVKFHGFLRHWSGFLNAVLAIFTLYSKTD